MVNSTKPPAGADRALSPDVRFGHSDLRSLHADCASPSWLRWSASPATGHGQPRPAPWLGWKSRWSSVGVATPSWTADYDSRSWVPFEPDL